MDALVIASATPIARSAGAEAEEPLSDWTQRYGETHRMRRISRWPAGIAPPTKIRVYFRNGHFLLQWWEPAARKNQAERVEGDLVSAVARAREIEQRLVAFKTSGRVGIRLRHDELVARFLADMTDRANGGEVAPRSVQRFVSALKHYVAFTETGEIARRFPHAVGVNRAFALGFASFLENRTVSPNGSVVATQRPMKGTSFVWDAARAMFQWGADPDRGHLLPIEFRNPFRHGTGKKKHAPDPFGEPDVTHDMAKALLGACDAYQLRLFALLLFYGLRASEPAYLFGEYIEGAWLRVPCAPELEYTTKGKRDKRLPLFDPLSSVLGPAQPGLLFVRRSVAHGHERPPLLGKPLAELIDELQRRLKQSGTRSAMQKQRIRDAVLGEAGAIRYDQIEDEFRKLANGLGWQAKATLKDLRHLFATSMAAAGMPEVYRQYLMGHRPSAAVINCYTHLNKVHEQYVAAIQSQWPTLIQAMEKRWGQLNNTSNEEVLMNINPCFDCTRSPGDIGEK